MLHKLFRRIDSPSYKTQSLNQLKQVLSIPSISAQNTGLKESATLLVRLFRQNGFKVAATTITGNTIVLARRIVNSNAPTILFYNHYDVQPPEPLEEWVTAPFKPSIRSGKLFARGAADNKGNLLARLDAVRAFDLARIPLPVNVIFLIDGREEVGSPGLPEFIRRYHKDIRADICIWEFGYSRQGGTPVLSLGCKGILYTEFTAKGANQDLHSSKGIIVPNPAWQLIWALNSMKDPQERILIKGFYDKVNFRIPKSRSVSGDPDGYRDKINKEFIPRQAGHLKIYSPDLNPTELGIKGFVLGLKGQKLLERYYYQPCLNINGLSGGYEGKGHKTVLPKQALAKVDFRLVPDQTPDDIIAKVRRHLNSNGFGDIAISSHHGYPPAITPFSHPQFNRFMGVITNAGKAVYNKAWEIEPISPASGPMYLFRDKLLNDMPCFALGIGHPGSNIHAPNENIYVSEYFQGVKFIAALMAEMPPIYNSIV